MERIATHRGVARRGVAWRSVAWRVVSWRGAARRGTVRRGKGERRSPRRGPVRQSRRGAPSYWPSAGHFNGLVFLFLVLSLARSLSISRAIYTLIEFPLKTTGTDINRQRNEGTLVETLAPSVPPPPPPSPTAFRFPRSPRLAIVFTSDRLIRPIKIVLLGPEGPTVFFANSRS